MAKFGDFSKVVKRVLGFLNPKMPQGHDLIGLEHL